VVVGRATARPGAGEMAVEAPRRARATKWTGTDGRACRRMCRRTARAWYMASARYGAGVRAPRAVDGGRWCVEWIRNNAAQCSPARHFPDYAGDFCLARVGEVYQSRACVYEMRRASMQE